MGILRPVALALALLLAGLVYAALDSESGIGTWRRLEGEVSLAEARIHHLRLRNARLRGEIRALEEEDPVALETTIREEIGWVRAGETRVSISSAEPPALP
jgi:cell division protein FtsB